MENMAYDLKPLWAKIIEIYKIYDQICERHALRSWGSYGTLLGAVRHKGFIPWDDDFDVIMPRPDYELFLSFADKELPPNLKIVNYRNTKEFQTVIFSKIVLCDKDEVDAVCQACNLPLHDGIFIDIFSLEGCRYPPKSRKWKWKAFFDFSRHVYRFRQSYRPRPGATLKAHIAFFVRKTVGWFVNLRTRKLTPFGYLRWIESRLVKNKFDECEYCGCYVPWWGDMYHVLPRSVFMDTVRLPFENVTIKSPRDFDVFLRSCFGDYMTPPPKDKQVLKHARETDSPARLGPTGLS